MGLIQFVNDNLLKAVNVGSWGMAFYFFLRCEKESLRIWGIIPKIIKSVLIVLPFIVIISVFNFLVINRYPLTPDLKAEIVARKNAVKLNPDDAVARFNLVVTYGYTNRLLKGYRQYGELNNIGEDNELWLTISRDFQGMVNADPSDWKARFRLAYSLYSIGKKKEGIKQLESVMEEYPDNVWAYVYAGLAYAGIRDRVKAVELFEKAREINPRIAAVHLGLGNGYKKIGRKEDSTKSYLKGVWRAICGW